MDTRAASKPVRWLALLLVTAVAWALAAGLSQARADSPAPADTGAADAPVVLRIGWNQMVDSLNPFMGYEGTSYALYHLNYDYLTQSDPATLQPVPSLAASWSSNDDLTTWTFKLREGVRWQDGEPFTVADVVYSVELNLSDEISTYDMYVGGVQSCTAIDDQTVELVFSTPQPRLLTDLTLVPIVPEHIWSKMTPAEAARKFQNEAPVIGTGPFQIVEFERDKYVRLRANPDFWGGRAQIDEIIFQMYTNNDTLAAELKAGVIQGGNVQAAAYRALEGSPGLATSLAHENGFDELGFNCYEGAASLGHPVLLDPAFRGALAWAIDRDKIAEIAWGGFAEPATTIIPADYYDESLDYHWEPPAAAAAYDPARCGELLDAAGYADSDGDGVREDKDGEPIKLRLWAASDKPEYSSAAKLITGWLEDVGIDVAMQVMEDGALSDRQYNYDENGAFAPDFDLFIWGWATGEDDPTFILSLLTTGQIEAWSDCNYSNERYDELYEAQTQEADPQARLAMVHEMQQIVYSDAPYIPLVYPLTREIYSSSWGGWVKQPEGTGSLWNRHSYLAVHPATASEESSGASAALVVGVVIAAVAIVAIVVFVLLRRRGARVEDIA